MTSAFALWYQMKKKRWEGHDLTLQPWDEGICWEWGMCRAAAAGEMWGTETAWVYIDYFENLATNPCHGILVKYFSVTLVKYFFPWLLAWPNFLRDGKSQISAAEQFLSWTSVDLSG